jgi:hypothetical protein
LGIDGFQNLPDFPLQAAATGYFFNKPHQYPAGAMVGGCLRHPFQGADFLLEKKTGSLSADKTAGFESDPSGENAQWCHVTS